MICYLIRHGQDDDSMRGGWSDCPLTVLGIQQSTALADNLSNNFNITILVKSIQVILLDQNRQQLLLQIN